MSCGNSRLNAPTIELKYEPCAKSSLLIGRLMNIETMRGVCVETGYSWLAD